MVKQRRKRQSFVEKTGYSAKILEPGYSGELSLEETQIIKRELENRSKLRKRWGFEEGEKITNTKIQRKALEESLENGILNTGATEESI